MWIRFILGKIFLKSCGYVYDYKNIDIKHFRKDTDIKIQLMTEQMLNILYRSNRYEILESKYQILKKRIIGQQGEVFAMTKNREILGFCCATDKKVFESGLRKNLSFPKDEIYFYDDYVLERFRRKSVHYMSILERLKYYENRGYISAYVLIHKENISSEKNYLSCGFVKKDIYFAIRCFKIVLKRKV